MYKYNDLHGMAFGKLSVVEVYGRAKDRHILWKCECECGKTINVSSRDLVSGHTKSCGCLQKETVKSIRYIHGDRDARLYSVWKSMKKRCENKKSKSYKWYGAKGVSVCNEWHDYSVFKKWAFANGYKEDAARGECTIDRIDPYGNYEPLNCRWVTMAEQAKNKRVVSADMRGGKDGTD
jgi:hypothetical protein